MPQTDPILESKIALMLEEMIKDPKTGKIKNKYSYQEIQNQLGCSSKTISKVKKNLDEQKKIIGKPLSESSKALSENSDLLSSSSNNENLELQIEETTLSEPSKALSENSDSLSITQISNQINEDNSGKQLSTSKKALSKKSNLGSKKFTRLERDQLLNEIEPELMRTYGFINRKQLQAFCELYVYRMIKGGKQ